MNHDFYQSKDDLVSHPDHYQSKKGIEVIDVIEAFTEGLDGIKAVDTGNAIKYLCRWSRKNGTQDLEKAMWYISHLIHYLNGENKPNSRVVCDRNELTCIKRAFEDGTNTHS